MRVALAVMLTDHQNVVGYVVWETSPPNKRLASPRLLGKTIAPSVATAFPGTTVLNEAAPLQITSEQWEKL